MILWELNQDHRANRPDPLLQAIKQTLQAPGLALERTGQAVSVNFTSPTLDRTWFNGAATCRLET